jgi:hypothetical protein
VAHPILIYFAAGHLKTPQRQVAELFGDLARHLDSELPDGPEKSVALRKLLEGKDAAVRSSLGLAEHDG